MTKVHDPTDNRRNAGPHTFVQTQQRGLDDDAHRLPLLRERLLAWAIANKGAGAHVPVPAGQRLAELCAFVDDDGVMHIPQRSTIMRALRSLKASNDLHRDSNTRCLILNPVKYTGGNIYSRKGSGCRRHRKRIILTPATRKDPAMEPATTPETGSWSVLVPTERVAEVMAALRRASIAVEGPDDEAETLPPNVIRLRHDTA